MAVSIKGKVKASFLSAGNSARERSDGAGGGVRSGMSGMGALYRKEMSDHIHSKRFLIVLLLILLTTGCQPSQSLVQLFITNGR